MRANRFFPAVLCLAGVLMLMTGATAVRADILRRVGGIVTPGGASQIMVRGDYAYVGDFYQGFRVVDVSNPAFPGDVTADTSQTVYGFAVAGDYAYLAGSHLRILSIANPAGLVEVGMWDGYGSGHPSAVAVAGDVAYTTDTNFTALNVADKTAPAFLGTCRLRAQGKDVVLAGSYAYVREDYGIEIVNIADPANPVVVGLHDFFAEDPSQSTASLFYQASYLYVTMQDSARALRVLDVSNPANPFEVGSLRIETNASVKDSASGVFVAGSRAYVGAHSRGLKVIDVSLVAGPAIILSSDESNFACYDVYLANDLIYVTDKDGVAIFRVESGPVAEDRAPTIELSPTEGFTFQASVVDGDGFAVRIQDDNGIRNADGSWHVDLGTIKVLVNGVDRTVRFVDTVLGNRLVRLVEVGNYALELQVRPDPEKFMAEHDMFYILKNGKHRIEFQVCDRTGLCGRSDNMVYFGPFAFLDGPVNKDIASLTFEAYIGNIGYGTTASVYCLLKTNGKGVRSYHGTWVSGIASIRTFPLPGGQYKKYASRLPFEGLSPDDENNLTSYRFLLGIMDVNTGTYTLDAQPIIEP